MPRVRVPLPLLAAGLAALLLAAPGGAAEDDEPYPLDVDFYKERIAPIVHEICAECHANPRKRLGRHFLRPVQGRRVRERHHEANLETLLRYIEPGNPAGSLWLLKPLGPTQGGVTHGGGRRIDLNSTQYGAMVDWINGAKLPPKVFTPPETEPGQPDFRFFFHRIEPVLLAICAECHEGRGQRRFRLVTHERGEGFPLEDHYANFQTVLALLRPGEPDRSRFLQKPLAEADGGLKHKGGDRIQAGGERHADWVAFINGEVGPPIPTAQAITGPRPLDATGLLLEAEDMDGPDEFVVEDAEASGFYVATGGAAGTRWTAGLLVRDPGAYVVELVTRPGPEDGWRVGFAGHLSAAHPQPADDDDGFVVRAPVHLLDGPEPLRDPRGAIWIDEGGHLALDGRQAAAAWLSPATVPHTGVALSLMLADEADGGDDGLLLFDAIDTDNAKFLGLTDGGRRLVLGVLEAGQRRVLSSARAPEQRRDDVGKPRVLTVGYYGGVAVGSLDGRPLVFANLGDRLRGDGAFGARTRGRMAVHRLAALEEYEVYVAALQTGPVVHLPRGRFPLAVEVPAGGVLDAVRLTRSRAD